MQRMEVAEVGRSVWKVAAGDPVAERVLSEALNLPPLVSRTLVARGMTDPKEVETFLHPDADQFHDPSLLPDYDRAVAAILNARETGQKIYVHGDYDVDGVTSAALFTRFLRKIGCDVAPHVPHRMKEGYGIHLNAVDAAASTGAKLFLTCDCGISAHEQVLAAREKGMRVVVTDHHLVGDTLPEAEAVVNPHRPGAHYPWPELSGVGVVFKLCAGITKETGNPVEAFYRAYLDLAVLGTVADVMPLLGENRVITSLGLPQLAATKKKGLVALLEVSNLKDAPRLTARNIGFQIGPRINAVGRIDDSALALDLLLTEDSLEANRLARHLDDLNTERRSEQNRIFEEACALVESAGPLPLEAIVVASEGWHPGVIGIVAGKIVERYLRPAFVAAIESSGAVRGSARSVPGFDLSGAIEHVRPLLASGGGHEMAAGFSLGVDDFQQFASELRQYSSSILTPTMCTPVYAIDAIVEGREAQRDAAEQLALLEPFGQANPEPVFATMGARIVSLTPTRNPEHVRLVLETADGGRQEAMAFGMGQAMSALDPDSVLDVAFTMDLSEWNGRPQFKWIVRGYRPSGA